MYCIMIIHRKIKENYKFIAQEMESLSGHRSNNRTPSQRTPAGSLNRGSLVDHRMRTSSVNSVERDSLHAAAASTPVLRYPPPLPRSTPRGSLTSLREPIAISRTLQAVPRQKPGPATLPKPIPNMVNVGSIYPIHLRLRSLSAAAEAAKLRGGAALDVLNNKNAGVDGNNVSNDHLSSPVNTNLDPNVIGKRALQPPAMRGRSSRPSSSRGSINESPLATSDRQRHTDANIRQQQDMTSSNVGHTTKPTRREFDLGEFAMYRNDIVFKLRGLGLRTGRRRKKKKENTEGKEKGSQEYDNMDYEGDDYDYSKYYGGGESEI